MAFTVAAKLAVFRTPDGDIWPAFRDRLDPLRATRQAALEAALSNVEFLRRRALARTLRAPAHVVREVHDGGGAGPLRLLTKPMALDTLLTLDKALADVAVSARDTCEEPFQP